MTRTNVLFNATKFIQTFLMVVSLLNILYPSEVWVKIYSILNFNVL